MIIKQESRPHSHIKATIATIQHQSKTKIKKRQAKLHFYDLYRQNKNLKPLPLKTSTIKT